MSIQAISQGTAQAAGSSVASASGSAPTAPASGTSASSANGSSAGASTSSYTVNISSTAHAMLAEATETSVQTAQEAAKGDKQAQRLLAKEAAAKVK
ncbi:MAG TPA: hypothetical protein VJS30_15720 [Paraburkholderia sp.]|nr:hypothetical protein [Paraburkholderia sp.]